LLFLPGRRETLRMLAVSCGAGALLFAPWFLFATWYYGSAIPHSLIAKQAWMENVGDSFLERLAALFRSLFILRAGAFDAVFTPPYAPAFNLLPPALVASRVLAAAASFVWIFPRVAAPGRIASLAFLGYMSYLSIFTPVLYPWYVPGATWLAFVALAFGFDTLRRFLRESAVSPSLLKHGSTAIVACVLLFGLAQTAVSADQFRLAQRVIEDGQRRRIGEWLKAQASSPHETVFVECAGYVGFFSGLKLYDYPGMTAPETVAARRQLKTEDFLELVKELRPDWIVLRPKDEELAGMWRKDSVYLKQNYRVMKAFDAKDAIDSARFKPFEAYLRHDQRFVVARKIM
jgi:hypothetical protein